jgi:hypothetical protein
MIVSLVSAIVTSIAPTTGLPLRRTFGFYGDNGRWPVGQYYYYYHSSCHKYYHYESPGRDIDRTTAWPKRGEVAIVVLISSRGDFTDTEKSLIWTDLTTNLANRKPSVIEWEMEGQNHLTAIEAAWFVTYLVDNLIALYEELRADVWESSLVPSE